MKDRPEGNPAQGLADPASGFPVQSVRDDFPVLSRKVRGKPLVYLDNAASTQKPRAVIEAVSRFYEERNSNVHRGVHVLSQEATDAFEGARSRVKRFLGAGPDMEAVFVRGATEAINLVAFSWGRVNLRPGDEILLTEMEHHANIVPWQLLREQTGAVLRVVPVDEDGDLVMEEYERLLGDRTRIVSVVHVSNALGTVNPVEAIIEKAHARGVPVLLDGAQAVPHMSLDLSSLGADFYVFSGHKVYGPTGIGVLVARKDILDAMPPYQGGGEMIRSVTFEETTYDRPPGRFEAGTPDIAGAVGLAAALDYVDGIGLERIAAREDDLLAYATAKVDEVGGFRIVGRARRKASVLSFVSDVAHPHDIGTILDMQGIAVRTGHHCTEPLMRRYGLPATARASFAFYNTAAEADALADALRQVREVMG